jgi:predicted acetyltransferase
MQCIINRHTVSLDKVTDEHRYVLQRMMELYVYDFTEYMDFDLDHQGLFHYPLDKYWDTQDTHRAYFIKVNGNYAGCVLQYTYINEAGEEIQTIAEFFVLKKYRKVGIGAAVAKMVMFAFPGKWLIYESKNNLPAQKFWRKVIAEATDNQFEEFYKDDKPNQLFLIPVDKANDS